MKGCLASLGKPLIATARDLTWPATTLADFTVAEEAELSVWLFIISHKDMTFEWRQRTTGLCLADGYLQRGYVSDTLSCRG